MFRFKGWHGYFGARHSNRAPSIISIMPTKNNVAVTVTAGKKETRYQPQQPEINNPGARRQHTPAADHVVLQVIAYPFRRPG